MLTPPNTTEPRTTSAPLSRLTTRHYVAWTLVGFWSVAVTVGMGLLVAYANSPGESSAVPASINASSDAATASYRLYMFVHPRCPCSFASMSELAQIMSRCSSQLDATVYFMRPASAPADWERGPLWDKAASIPGVQTAVDAGGHLAEQFHVHTSGEVLIYDRAGKLCFHGGITSARGHAGDNLGESAVISLALKGTTHVECSPIFGCPLSAQVADTNK